MTPSSENNQTKKPSDEQRTKILDALLDVLHILARVLDLL